SVPPPAPRSYVPDPQSLRAAPRGPPPPPASGASCRGKWYQGREGPGPAAPTENCRFQNANSAASPGGTCRPQGIDRNEKRLQALPEFQRRRAAGTARGPSQDRTDKGARWP